MVDREGFEPGDGEKVANSNAIVGMGESATAWARGGILAQGEYVPSSNHAIPVPPDGAERPIWLGAQSVNSMNHVLHT